MDIYSFQQPLQSLKLGSSRICPVVGWKKYQKASGSIMQLTAVGREERSRA